MSVPNESQMGHRTREATQEAFDRLNESLEGVLGDYALAAKDEGLASDQGSEEDARKAALHLERSEFRLKKAWPDVPGKLLASWKDRLQHLGLIEDQGTSMDNKKTALAEHLALRSLVFSPEASQRIAAGKQQDASPAVHVDF